MASASNIQEFQATIDTECNPDVTVTSELHVTANVTPVEADVTTNELQFPATQTSVAKYFGWKTHHNLSKTWIKPLTEKGYKIFDESGRKITKKGFGTLQNLITKQGQLNVSPREVIEDLPSVGQLEETAIAAYQPQVQAISGYTPPVLTTVDVELDLGLLKKPSVNQTLDFMIQESQARETEAINQANEVSADLVKAEQQIQELARSTQSTKAAQAFTEKGLRRLGELQEHLGKL